MKGTWKDWLMKVAAFFMMLVRNIKKILVVIVAVAVVIGAIILVSKCMRTEHEELEIEDTIASIEEVRPRGEIYVCSSIIEDYTIKRETERRLLMPNVEHSCVQTMTQKCSYVIDLDKVEYMASDSSRTVWVKLPPLRYVASTQSTSFVSDDENYWSAHIPNTNALKAKVEAQIKQRFDTPNNRRKAERYAEDAISEVLNKMGYQTEFVRTLEQKKD